MSRFIRRQLLTDAALATVLLVLTLGPGLFAAMLQPRKPGDPTTFLSAAGVPSDSGWWLYSGLVLTGLIFRRQWPVPALALVAAGTVGHLSLQTKFQLLDLALPLALYTVAATARRRHAALGILALAMILTYLGMLAGRIDNADQQNAAIAAKQALLRAEAADDPGAKVVVGQSPVVSVDVLVGTSQSVLEMWLLSVAAFAIGDGIRSRRAHLAAVEQRTADLAREERQRAALAVAAERTRITRELHDVVAHGMSVMVVQAQGAQAALERHPDRAADALRHVIDIGRSSLAEMRRLLAAGRADSDDGARLTPLPGIGAVPALIDDMRLAGMPIDLVIEGVPEAVPAAVDLSAYRIVQEALTNILKHAGAGARARVLLDFHPDRVRVEVADNGKGAAGAEDGHGSGLRGIAERVAIVGGELETGRGDGGSGFRLAAMLPLAADLAGP